MATAEIEDRDLDEDIDADEDEDEQEASRPRARARRRPLMNAAQVASMPASLFGVVPKDATHWGIKRRGVDGKWARLGYQTSDGNLEVREWPIAELNEEVMRKRWGAGTYRVVWCGIGERGGMHAITNGRHVTLLPTGGAQPAAAPRVDDNVPGLTQAIQLMNLIDQRATTQLTAFATLAKLNSNQNQGVDAATLERILEKQAAGFREVLDEVKASNRAQIDELRREMYEDDGEPSVVGEVAKAAAPAFRPGKPMGDQIKSMIANYAMQNPDKIVDALRAIPAVVEAIAKAAPQPRPRAVPRVQPPAPAVVDAEPEGPVVVNGMNDFFNNAKPEAPAS